MRTVYVLVYRGVWDRVLALLKCYDEGVPINIPVCPGEIYRPTETRWFGRGTSSCRRSEGQKPAVDHLRRSDPPCDAGRMNNKQQNHQMCRK